MSRIIDLKLRKFILKLFNAEDFIYFTPNYIAKLL